MVRSEVEKWRGTQLRSGTHRRVREVRGILTRVDGVVGHGSTVLEPTEHMHNNY